MKPEYLEELRRLAATPGPKQEVWQKILAYRETQARTRILPDGSIYIDLDPPVWLSVLPAEDKGSSSN